MRKPPNENAHQLRAIVPAPTRTYVSLAAPSEGAARTEAGAHSARRLHARVRRQPGADQLYLAEDLRTLGPVVLA
jgi:hypothetical protein